MEHLAFCHMLLGFVVLLLACNLLGIAIFICLAIGKYAIDDGSSRHVRRTFQLPANTTNHIE